MLVAGVDGCPGGWVAVIRELDGEAARTVLTIRIIHLTALIDGPDSPSVIALDMPIGLPDRVPLPGRAPERLVRPLLGGRQSSVFSIPSRSTVYAGVDEAVPEAERYQNACAVARATSDGGKAVAKQAFHLFSKMVEIDRLLRAEPALREVFFESHPEVALRTMAGAPLTEPKKVKGTPYPPGLELRRKTLLEQGLEEETIAAERAKALRVGPDDLIDAAALSWTAARIARGLAVSYPSPPERDGEGLPIAIWA